MQKPKNYEKLLAASNLDALRLGGHRMVIKGVTESTNRYGEAMTIIQVDTDVSDDQAGQFSKMYDLDDRSDKKWPNVGTQYISVVDAYTGCCSRPFAAFIAAVEKSNPGFKVNWDAPAWGSQFTGLKVGAVFGRVETDWTGEAKLRTELRYFCSIDHVAEAPVPKDKLLKPATPVEAALRKNRPAV